MPNGVREDSIRRNKGIMDRKEKSKTSKQKYLCVGGH